MKIYTLQVCWLHLAQELFNYWDLDQWDLIQEIPGSMISCQDQQKTVSLCSEHPHGLASMTLIMLLIVLLWFVEATLHAFVSSGFSSRDNGSFINMLMVMRLSFSGKKTVYLFFFFVFACLFIVKCVNFIIERSYNFILVLWLLILSFFLFVSLVSSKRCPPGLHFSSPCSLSQMSLSNVTESLI